MNFIKHIAHRKSFLFLFGTAIIFFVLRIPSFVEPYWYGDEGIYQTIGLALRHGRVLYTGIWDNKPPLLYILYALFSGDQFALRILSTVASIAAILLFFFVAKKLFAKERPTYLATSLLALLLVSPLLEGNIANAENFMMAPVLLAILLILTLVLEPDKSPLFKKRNRIFFFSGLLLSIGFLCKIVAIFDLASVTVFLFFFALPHNLTRKSILHELKPFLADSKMLFSGFLLPILLFAIYFAVHGALSAFLYAAFLSNFGYVGYGNTFIIPQGLLILKLLLLFLAVCFIFLKRQKIAITSQFILLWVFFSLFNVFFSQRPYTHYLLLIVPSFALLVGLLFDKTKYRLVYIVFAFFIIIVLSKSFHLYSLKKTLLYYGNFLSYVSNKKSTNAYWSFFDGNTPRDYDIAAYLSAHTNPGDTTFLWGDDAMIYPLSRTIPPGRYTVSYHIKQYKGALDETNTILEKHPPKYIVILPNGGNFPFSLYNYRYKFSLENSNFYERIEKNNSR